MTNFKDFGKKLETISAINMTPFKPENREVDWEALDLNIRFLIDNGTKVIVPCGNTGEFYALTLEEAKEEIRRVVEVATGEATIVAGVGYAVDTALELGNYAKDVGADAIMILQPIHPYVTNSGIISYFKKIMKNVDLPVILYFKDPNISDDVLKELAPIENFVGVKYAINDLPRFAKLVRSVPEENKITWICGTAEKWAPFFYHVGAKGFTSGLINVYPQKAFEMLNALKAGDQETVWKSWEDSVPFENLRAKYNNGNNVAVVKEAMEQIGLKGGITREPVDPLNDQDKAEVRGILKSWSLL